MEQPTNLFEFQIDHEGREEFTDLARWTKVQAIAVMSILGLLGFSVIFNWNKWGFLFALAYTPYSDDGPMIVVLIVTLLVFIVIGFLLFFLIRSSYRIRMGVRMKDQFQLNAGLSDLRKYFAIFGVISILILLINLLNFL